MYLRRFSKAKYFWGVIFFIFVYCEYLHYIVRPLFWQSLECEDQSCTKILFIADPQIQGDEAVAPPLSYLFNWDSDGYLKITFSVVLNWFKPDVLVYLGDLMDEGSISSKKQYHQYVKRLGNIFNVDYPVMQVWLPGDNDIGGENEPIRTDKVEEFENVFKQPPMITYKNISIYKINAITLSLPLKNENDNNFKIAVSHYPVTRNSMFSNHVNSQIHPNIYFCAHDHESKYVKQDGNLNNRETYLFESGSEILQLNFNDNNFLYEIYVPTCSYRMGTPKIGFGAAVFDNSNKNMRYTVFWSPKRFPILFFYLMLLTFVTLYILTFYIAKFIIRCIFLRSSDRNFGRPYI